MRSEFRALDNGSGVFLVLLEFSAAFDTLDHDILLDRLDSLGVSGAVLQRMNSYLRGRSQTVVFDGVKSEPQDLQYGIPRGSILGPILFTIYTIPIGAIAQLHNLEIHIYADDTQFYVFFKIKDPISQHKAPCTLQSCISEIRAWTVTNMLHLNDDKTVFLTICAPWRREGVTVSSLTVGSSHIAASSAARNLGVIMNQALNTDTYVQRLSQTAMIHLRNIADIRRCLSHDVAEKLIHAFVIPRLDYSNGLLFGMSAAPLRKLQRVQNTATSILTGSRKYYHITPVLRQLHWLPMEYRVRYKMTIGDI